MSINSENVYTKNPCDENVNMSDTTNKEDVASDNLIIPGHDAYCRESEPDDNKEANP